MPIFSFLITKLFNKRFRNALLDKFLFKKFSIRKVWWLIERKKKIRNYLNKHQIKKLQIGSGANIIEGWLNTNVVPQKKDIILLDSREIFPFKDKTFDYIFSEHQIEHITYKEGLFMLQECFRILKPGGKIRIATPDLKVFVGLYKTENKSKIQEQYTKAVIDYCFPYRRDYNSIFVLNNIFNNYGHKFVYDFETLKTCLEKAGFVDVTRIAVGESSDENLQGIERHGKLYETYGIQDGEELNKFETMVLEARV